MVTTRPALDSSKLSERLEHFIALIASEDHAQEISHRCGLPPERARLLLNTYCNEARVGLSLVAASLRPGLRVLEVGTGVGLLASVLAEQGVNIVGVEPGDAGFGFMPTLASIVTVCVGLERPFVPLSIGVAALEPAQHGQFDLIYSINVLEHLSALDAAIAAMARVLAENGTMVHMCPNYAVPYEPHLTIPLIPGAPYYTRYLFPSHARRYPGLWDELNFITAGRLRRLSRKHGLTARFDSGVMGAMVRRILTDPILAARQGAGMRMTAAALQKTGGLAVIDRIPAGLSTPMIARLAKS